MKNVGTCLAKVTKTVEIVRVQNPYGVQSMGPYKDQYAVAGGKY